MFCCNARHKIFCQILFPAITDTTSTVLRKTIVNPPNTRELSGLTYRQFGLSPSLSLSLSLSLCNSIKIKDHSIAIISQCSFILHKKGKLNSVPGTCMLPKQPATRDKNAQVTQNLFNELILQGA